VVPDSLFYLLLFLFSLYFYTAGNFSSEINKNPLKIELFSQHEIKSI